MRCATWCSSTAGKEDFSLLKRKIEWESDGTDDYGNQRVSVASFFDGCLMTLVDEVERTGSKLVHSSGSRSVYTLLHQH